MVFLSSTYKHTYILLNLQKKTFNGSLKKPLSYKNIFLTIDFLFELIGF